MDQTGSLARHACCICHSFDSVGLLSLLKSSFFTSGVSQILLAEDGVQFRNSQQMQLALQAEPDVVATTTEGCLQVLEPQLQTAHTAAQLAYAGTASGGDDTSRELERSPSDTSLDCESPRPPPSGAGAGLGRAWTSEDVVGSCRTTVLRGESDVTRPSLSIVGCHEACVYVLAPMKHILVSCCADCVIVVRCLPPLRPCCIT